MFRRLPGAGAVLCAALVLSGCGVSTLTSSFSGGIFGGGNKQETPTEETTQATAAQISPGGQTAVTAPGEECPSVAVAAGEGNITFNVKGGAGDNLSVLHRGEISKTSRECAPGINGGLNVKFGFAGRVLLGPQGKPGTVTLPVKITLIDPNRAAVKTEQVKVPVTITADQPAGYFSVVREVLVPVPPGTSPRSYRILVAFDRKVPGAS